MKRKARFSKKKGALHCFHLFHTCVSEVYHLSINCFPLKHLLYTQNLRGRSFLFTKREEILRIFFIQRAVGLFVRTNKFKRRLSCRSFGDSNCEKLPTSETSLPLYTVKIENSRQRDQSEEKNFQAKSRISSV